MRPITENRWSDVGLDESDDTTRCDRIAVFEGGEWLIVLDHHTYLDERNMDVNGMYVPDYYQVTAFGKYRGAFKWVDTDLLYDADTALRKFNKTVTGIMENEMEGA